jgi:hypothetical protein
MPSIAARTQAIVEERGEAPWPGHEYVRGWGVFGLPFDSGHVLALRVFPQNPFAPYRTVWHRDPGGAWSIYADAPRLDIACPRYYGAACDRVAQARIQLAWTAPGSLRVTVEEPALEWAVSVARSPILGVLNPLSAALPLATWRPRLLVRARERLARALGMGRLELSGTMPSGHDGLLMPQRMYLVDQSEARPDGTELGRPTRLADNPTIGGVPLPARGVLAVGQAVWRIRDPEEYARLRHDTDPQTAARREITS